MKQKTFIAYYRVSTKEQGTSGLGLSAQKEAVRRFVTDDTLLVSEYQEVESGTNDSRPQLQKAIKHAKKTNSKLIIAKLDRLSRNAKFVFTLRDTGVDFICADMPEANTLTIALLAVLAEDEARRISERTSSALSEIKSKIKRGETHISKSGNIVTQLGNPENLTDEARSKAMRVKKQKAINNPESKKAGAFIVSLYNSGNTNFADITRQLNESGFKTPRGCEFNPVQTKRLFNRYKN